MMLPRFIPRTDGVSSSVRVRCILPRPRPFKVAICTAGRRAGLLTCFTVTVLPDFFSAIMQFLRQTPARPSDLHGAR